MPLFATLSPEQLTALRDRILARFNLEELRLLVVDLGGGITTTCAARQSAARFKPYWNISTGATGCPT